MSYIASNRSDDGLASLFKTLAIGYLWTVASSPLNKLTCFDHFTAWYHWNNAYSASCLAFTSSVL